jgi:hypothetical protein
MPLLDHFVTPLDLRRDWESFHARWATSIADLLDRTLPPRYFAAVQTHSGHRIEADVAEFEYANGLESSNGDSERDGGVAVQTWAPPKATFTIPTVFPDEYEVQVFDTRAGATLVAVIELISPANKDREETRQAFTAKCSAYLQRGLGLLIVDVITVRRANLHNELMRQRGHGPSTEFTPETTLYAAAYHPKHQNEKNEIDVWLSALAVDESLPVLPLALRGGMFVPVDLEATYTETRQRSRL